MKQYKIAICFSGQMRTWEKTHEAIKSFFDIENSPHIIDTFAHTWNYNTWINNKKVNILEDTQGTKYQDYSDVEIALEEIEKFKQVYDFKKFVVHKKLHNPNTHWDNFFYSFMYSIFLKRQYEIENNFEYDIVIKTRPDAIFNFTNSDIFSADYDSNRKFIYKPQAPLSITSCLNVNKMPFEWFSNNLDDVFFWGDSLSMDLLSDCYRWYRHNCSISQQTPELHMNMIAFKHYGPGSSLYKYSSELGMAVMHEFKPWKIVRNS